MGRSMSHCPRPPPCWPSLPLPPTLLREHACYQYATLSQQELTALCSVQTARANVALLLHALLTCDAVSLYTCRCCCLPALFQCPAPGYACTACARLLHCVRKTAPSLEAPEGFKDRWRTVTLDVAQPIRIQKCTACVNCCCQALLLCFQQTFRQAATLSACSSSQMLRSGVLLAELGILRLTLPYQLPLPPL